MPLGTLPKSAKKLWEQVYNDSKAKGADEATAAKKAWAAVKQAGWRKDAKGQWHKSNLVEFSLAITKASYNPKTGERRWVATASDTDIDSYGDKMSMELFEDFIDRINKNDLAPEEFRTSFWSGGMPYLSISHYPDLDGDAVPGELDAVFIDGNKFKSKGRFNGTPLGLAAYEAVKKDLLEKSDNPVRISIAFLDYKHRHLSDGYVFERNLNDKKRVVCPKCVEEAIIDEYGGKEFLQGQLVHLAMTRVPVNKRTLMEVERSEMTTRKEDAASIIGEELAEELDKKAKLVGKSEALIIKADEEDVSLDVETEETIEMMKNEEYKLLDGVTSMKEANKIIEFKKDHWKISDLWWTLQDVISNILSSDDIEDKSKAIASAVDEFKDMLGSKEAINMAQIILSVSKKDEEDKDEDEGYENEKKEDEEEMKLEVKEVSAQPTFTLEMLSDAVRAGNIDMVQRLDILISSLSQNLTSSGIPQRRSVVPPPNYNPPVVTESKNLNQPLSIGDFVRRSV